MLIRVALLLCVLVTFAANQPTNHAPNITFFIPYTGKKGVLPQSEDTPLNSYLALMEAKDDGNGTAGEVVCQTENPYINLSLVYPTMYKVALAKALDREEASSVHVVISCSDRGSPALTSSDSFTVEVVDINDNAPTFGVKTYQVNVTENVPLGSLVTTIQATDPDAGVNSVVKYSLEDSPDSAGRHFRVEEDSGKILTAAEIDREMMDNYRLTLVARDTGQPSLSSSTQVLISVLDINDNTPVILTKTFYVLENQPSMTDPIGQLMAEDLDTGKNAEVVFSKLEDSGSSSAAVPFMVTPNGQIYAVMSLNREDTPEYVLRIMVRDNGSPRRNSTATVLIFVEDVNDLPPIFLSDCLGSFENASGHLPFTNNGSNGFVTINWYSPEGDRSVYQPIVVDNDLGESSEVHFSLGTMTNGQNLAVDTTNPLFKIDSSTGEVSLLRHVHRGDNLVQILNISVSDKGIPPLSSFCLVNVTIDVDVSLLATADPQKTRTKSSTKTVFSGVSSTRSMGFSGAPLLLPKLHLIMCVVTAAVVLTRHCRV